MSESVFTILGAQLRTWRARQGLSQPALAARLGRDRARISELERDLAGERWGRDRLTLFAEACDALGVVPLLVPLDRTADILRFVEGAGGGTPGGEVPLRSAFDELFVDLGEEAAVPR